MSAARRTYHHGNLREALLEASLDGAREGGAGALSLRDATRRAGVSPTAAYRHFADRDALLAATATRIQERAAERMRGFEHPAGSDAATARSRLTAVGLGYIAFALDEPGWFDLAFGRITALPSDAALPAPLAALVGALDALAEAGVLAAERRPGAEWVCWSTVHGFALLALSGPLRSLPRDQVWEQAERAVATVIDGLLQGPGSPRT